MDRTPVHLAVLAIVEDATTGDLSSANVAIERAVDAGHKAVAQDLATTEAEIRAQITRWIGQPQIDVVVVVGDDRGATKAALAPLVTEALPGFANVWAARCSSKIVFVLPPMAGTARSAMDTTVLPRLDSRRSDSLVKLLPRLAQPRGKSRTGKNVVKRGEDDDFDPPTKPIDVQKLEHQIAMSSADNPTRQVDLAKLSSMAAAQGDDDDDDDELALKQPKRPAFIAAKTTVAMPPTTPKPAGAKPAPPVLPARLITPSPRPSGNARSTMATPAMGAPVAGSPPPVPPRAAPPAAPPMDRAAAQTPAMGAPITATPPAMPRAMQGAAPAPPPPPARKPAAQPPPAATPTPTSAQPPPTPTVTPLKPPTAVVAPPKPPTAVAQPAAVAQPPKPPTVTPRPKPPTPTVVAPPKSPTTAAAPDAAQSAGPPRKPPIQTPPMGAPIAASASPAGQSAEPSRKPPLQTPPMGAPIAASAPPAEPPPPPPRKPPIQTPPMGAPIATAAARRAQPAEEPKHVVLVSAADPSDRGWTQPMEPVAKPNAPMPTDPGSLPVERAARPSPSPSGTAEPPPPPRRTVATPVAASPTVQVAEPATPPPTPRRTVATPPAAHPVVERDGEITDVLPIPTAPARPIVERDGEITDVLPIPTAPARPMAATPPAGVPMAPPRPMVATPPAGSPIAPPPMVATPPAGSPIAPLPMVATPPAGSPIAPPRPTFATPPAGVAIAPPPPPRPPTPTPPPPMPIAQPNLWDAPENLGAVPQPTRTREKTMMVRIPRGPSKGVIALLLVAAACAAVAAAVVVLKHGKTAPPDAGVAMVKPPVVATAEVDAAVENLPDAAEPDLEVVAARPDAGAARTRPTPPTHVEPTHVEPTHVEPTHVEPTHVAPTHVESTHVEPTHVEPTHVEPTHTGSATVAPIEPAKPVAPGPPLEAGCDEVSCVLDRYARPCCARYKPADTGFDPKLTMPDRLDRAAVKEGVEHMKPRVIACGERNAAKGTVKLSITVAPNGSVSDVSVSETPDAALGECVASALRKATFAKTINGATFVYPFAF